MKKMQIEPLPRNAAYRFDQPIRIVRYRPAGLDIMFYSALLGLSITAVFFLLCFHDGKIQFYFTFFRTLLSFPFVLLALLMQSLLKELRFYTKALLKKSTWTLEELMELTQKDRQETERIITRVLEAPLLWKTAASKADLDWRTRRRRQRSPLLGP